MDGVETDSVIEIDPNRRLVTFRMGNGSQEVLEVHDFKNVSKKDNQIVTVAELNIVTVWSTTLPLARFTFPFAGSERLKVQDNIIRMKNLQRDVIFSCTVLFQNLKQIQCMMEKKYRTEKNLLAVCTQLHMTTHTYLFFHPCEDTCRHNAFHSQ